MQDGNNSSSRTYGDQEWKDQGRHGQKNDWDRDQTSNVRGRSREERSGSRSDRRSSTDGRMGSHDERDSNTGTYGENSGSYDGMDSRMGSYDSRIASSNRMGRYGNDREDSMGNQQSGHRDSAYSGRNDFQSDDYGSVSNQYQNYFTDFFDTQNPITF